MNTQQYKHLKEGDNVFVRGVVKSVGIGDVLISLTLANGEKTRVWVSMNRVGESWTVPSNPPSSPAPCASKYDPCRIFKKGDKVRVVGYKGRIIGINGSVVVVEEDENVRENKVLVRHDVGGLWWIDAAYLELVTPVEELEPYFVMELKGAYGVYNTRFQPETAACHFFTDMHPHAKEAAEAECARLNAEHRKESGK